MINRYLKKLMKLSILILILAYIGLGFIYAADPPQEITVTGSAVIGEDPDRMYKDAMVDAFQKAYNQNHPKDYSAIDGMNNSAKDPVSIQRELGIVEYQVQRYWQENGRFFIELKVVFGDSTSEAPRPNGLSRLAKLNWTYQTADQIKTMAKTKTALAVNTTQTIEVIDPENGHKLEQYKMGLNPHNFYEDYYLVQEGDYLKAAKLNKLNILNLVFIWRKKFPDFVRYFLTRDILFVVEKTGLINALGWEDGAVQWQLPASSQAEIEEVVYHRFLITFTNPDLWMVNAHGEKLWTIKLESGLLAKPLTLGNEIYCLLKNGEIKVIDRESGKIISTWNVKSQSSNRNIELQLSEKELFIMFNDANKGHLQAYHRLTGKFLWEVGWDHPAVGSILNVADVVIVGVGNSFEARDPLFGMKLWEEPTYGRVTKLYSIDEKIFVVAGNRVYGYDLK